MLAPVRTVDPAAKPISLVEAKRHCRVDDDNRDNDPVLSSLIDTVTAHLDGYSGILGRALITQTWRQDFPGFSDCMRLPLGDLISVTSVTYYDADNAQQTLATSVYQGLSDARGPFLTLKPDESWPTTYSRPDAVRVTWTAGYGATSDSVPAAIRHAALLLVGHWFDSRAAVRIGDSVTELPFAVNALLTPYRRVGT